MPLPVAAPVAALAVDERVGGAALELVTVGFAPHVLAPRHLARVELEVYARDMVVLPVLGPAQPREVALGLIGAGPLVREREAVVDPVRLQAGVQGVPVRRLVGVDRAAGLHPTRLATVGTVPPQSVPRTAESGTGPSRLTTRRTVAGPVPRQVGVLRSAIRQRLNRWTYWGL